MNVFYIGAEQSVQLVADGKTVKVKSGQSVSVSASTGAGLVQSMNWTAELPEGSDIKKVREEKEAARVKAEQDEAAKEREAKEKKVLEAHKKRFPDPKSEEPKASVQQPKPQIKPLN